MIDRHACLTWFDENRRRSRRWFDMLTPEAYRARPIALRHPVIFYEGHVAAFNVNTLLKRGLGRPGVDGALEALFERGIDPLEEHAATAIAEWPTRAAVLAFAAAADESVRAALEHDTIDDPDNPVLRGGLAVYTILEHETVHHETLLYMFHRLGQAQKRLPDDYRPVIGGAPPLARTIRIPAGPITLGADPARLLFGWDNEFPEHRVHVGAFEIDAFDVTNAEYLAFVEAGGYAIPEYWSAADWTWRTEHGITHPAFWERAEGRWYWRGLFERVPLPPAWPVYVSHAEASAYARWRGRRLPTEAEYHRAAFGTPVDGERMFPWGDAAPDATRGNFDWRHWDPVPVGSYPAGASAWGVHDLVGNGWEWTSTVFDGFTGFTPMASYPGYSADFFDHRHYVLKGASPATGAALIRRSWRNWFQAHYPYVYASFRCVSS